YACLVGANLPTVRATLMIATYVVAYLLDRDRDPWQTTALAALLILALHPQSLFDLGFQLSFAGVLAILTRSTSCTRQARSTPSTRNWSAWGLVPPRSYGRPSSLRYSPALAPHR
ncbi:MAG TPA: ComEC/Rec2 family competence protein, partial [Candidatus Tectomicrobia bacterium]|nr:ComEC/Rec2 family competence protein [Candidatus Tectomicrobia bacterium]